MSCTNCGGAVSTRIRDEWLCGPCADAAPKVDDAHAFLAGVAFANDSPRSEVDAFVAAVEGSRESTFAATAAPATFTALKDLGCEHPSAGVIVVDPSRGPIEGFRAGVAEWLTAN